MDNDLKPIGPDFATDLRNHGLFGATISWDSDGNIWGRETLTSEQNAALDQAISEHDPARQPVIPFILTKLQITSRMSDAQLDQFDAELQAQGTRLRRAWADCQDVDSSYPLYQTLYAAMSEQWGAAEAARILGP